MITAAKDKDAHGSGPSAIAGNETGLKRFKLFCKLEDKDA